MMKYDNRDLEVDSHNNKLLVGTILFICLQVISLFIIYDNKIWFFGVIYEFIFLIMYCLFIFKIGLTFKKEKKKNRT